MFLGAERVMADNMRLTNTSHKKELQNPIIDKSSERQTHKAERNRHEQYGKDKGTTGEIKR